MLGKWWAVLPCRQGLPLVEPETSLLIGGDQGDNEVTSNLWDQDLITLIFNNNSLVNSNGGSWFEVNMFKWTSMADQNFRLLDIINLYVVSKAKLIAHYTHCIFIPAYCSKMQLTFPNVWIPNLPKSLHYALLIFLS